MAFASGRFSRAICDRCGQQYKYQDLKQEWNGLFTCPSCYEPKHPQLDPPYHPPDPEALQDPRVESNKILKSDSPPGPNDATSNTFGQPMPVTVFVGDPGDSAFMTTVQGTSPADGSAPTTSSSMLPQVLQQKFTMNTKQGLVSIPEYTRVNTLMTVAAKGGGASGNAYYSGGVQQPTLGFNYQTVRYIAFADNSSINHPMLLSTTSDGTHGGGSTYTTNVYYLLGDVPNQTYVSQSTYIAEFSESSPQRRTLAIFLDSSTPSVLYYYCQNHSGMGGQINIST